jgi:plasmid stabilization system protein ParE
VIVAYSDPAKAELRKIAEWISEENPRRADSFIDELIDACERIMMYPESNAVLGTFLGHVVRRKVFGNYLIFYRVKQNQVEILHVLHGAQDYSDLF